MSPWGASDLEQQGGSRVEAAPGGAGARGLDGVIVARRRLDARRPAAMCNEQGSLNAGPTSGLLLLFLCDLPHYLQMDCFNLEKRETHPCPLTCIQALTQLTRNKVLWGFRDTNRVPESRSQVPLILW